MRTKTTLSPVTVASVEVPTDVDLGSDHVDDDMARALGLLAAAFRFEVVNRCPGPCIDCDTPLPHAA